MKKLVLFVIVACFGAQAANYSAQRTTRDGVEVVVLSDAARHTEVTVVPSMGNTAFERKVNGRNVLNTPAGSLEIAKLLLEKAQVAVSPGIGFGPLGEGFVRFALVENEHRTNQATTSIRKFLKGKS
jgi:hypothetical protein